MELKFVRQWKFSTRNKDHAINPGIEEGLLLSEAMMTSTIKMSLMTMIVMKVVACYRTDNDSSDEEEVEVEVLNYFPSFGLDLEYGFVFLSQTTCPMSQ